MLGLTNFVRHKNLTAFIYLPSIIQMLIYALTTFFHIHIHYFFFDFSYCCSDFIKRLKNIYFYVYVLIKIKLQFLTTTNIISERYIN